MTPRKIILLAGAGLTLALTAVFSTSLFETNLTGYMQVKQAAVSGDLSCRLEGGTYPQMFGDIHTYKEASTFYFGLDDPAHDDVKTVPLTTTFADGAKSKVSGSVRVLLPQNCEQLVHIHRKFKSMNGVMTRLVLPALRKVAFQTGPHMTSAESYSERRGEFASLLEDQLLNGIIEVDKVAKTHVDPITGKEEEIFVLQKRPCVDASKDDCIGGFERKAGVFNEFDISLTNFEVADISYTDSVLKQIEAQRTARMDIITQEAEAQKAEARAKKAKSEAQALIEETRAKEEVAKTQRTVKAEADKVEATLQAEKLRDVAKLEKEAAEFTKKKEILLGEGEAARKRLVMQADGALEKKLEALQSIHQSWAQAYSNRKVPATVFGGGGNGNAVAGSDTDVQNFMRLMNMQAVKQLSVDVNTK